MIQNSDIQAEVQSFFSLLEEVKDPEIRILGTGGFLGLVTYFIHGFINNFLDTDKLSLPFWSFLSIMLCIDLFHKGEEPKEQP